MDYSITYKLAINYSRLKFLFNLHVKKTVRRQDFSSKLNLANHNRAPVADILKCLKFFLEPLWGISRKLLIQSRNQNILLTSKMNWTLR